MTVVLAADAFDRADTTGPLGALDVGGVWTEDHGNSGIAGGRYYGVDVGGGINQNTAYVDVATDEVYVSVELGARSAVSGSSAGVLVRHVDWETTIRGVFQRDTAGGNDVLVQRVIGGVATTIMTGPVVAVGDRMGVRARGQTLELLVNDVVVDDYSGTEAETFLGETLVGIYSQVAADFRLDDWRAESVEGPGGWQLALVAP